MGSFGQFLKGAAGRSPHAIVVLAAGGIGVLPGIARAGDWTVTPRASLTSIFTDNANTATDREDRNSDLLITAAPGVSISGTGGRFSLTLNYSHTEFMSYQDTADQTATNTLAANGRAELYDRVAFMDATSSISRQVIDSARPVSSVDTGSSNNRTTVQTASLQPYFLHHFGTWLETESRSGLNVTRTLNDEVAETKEIRETVNFNSGRRFSVFTFSGSLDDRKTIRDAGAPSSDEMTATTNYRYRIYPGFSLLSSLGWENIDDASLTTEPKGMTWNAGFAVQPNSRSSFELTYGTKYQEQNINFSGNYALSNRTSIAASYTETLTSSERRLNEDLSFIVDNGTGVLIDSRTGQIYNPANSNFDFQTSLFRQQVFTLSASTTRRRTSYTAGINWERRKTDSTGIKEEVMGAELSASRPINSRLSATLSTSFTHRDFGTEDERVDRVASFSAGLTYVLTQNTNTALRYARNQTQSSEGANNFHDNTVTLSLIHTF